MIMFSIDINAEIHHLGLLNTHKRVEVTILAAYKKKNPPKVRSRWSTTTTTRTRTVVLLGPRLRAGGLVWELRCGGGWGGNALVW